MSDPTRPEATGRRPTASAGPAPATATGPLMKRADAVRALVGRLGADDLVVCCNGMVGRELWTFGERPGNFYMIGSMGLGLGIAIGVALSRPDRRVIALDGDGNVLMGLSTLATAATEPVGRLLHVVLDNGVHASTGGQRTISRRVGLEQVALAAGYRSARRVTTLEALDAALAEMLAAPADAGPAMLLAVVEPGNVKGIGRVELSPADLAARFSREVRRGAPGAPIGASTAGSSSAPDAPIGASTAGSSSAPGAPIGASPPAGASPAAAGPSPRQSDPRGKPCKP